MNTRPDPPVSSRAEQLLLLLVSAAILAAAGAIIRGESREVTVKANEQRITRLETTTVLPGTAVKLENLSTRIDGIDKEMARLYTTVNDNTRRDGELRAKLQEIIDRLEKLKPRDLSKLGASVAHSETEP